VAVDHRRRSTARSRAQQQRDRRLTTTPSHSVAVGPSRFQVTRDDLAKPYGGEVPDVISSSREVTTPHGLSPPGNENCRSRGRQLPTNLRLPARESQTVTGSTPFTDRTCPITQRARSVTFCNDLTASPIPVAWSRGCTGSGSDDILPRSAAGRLILDSAIGVGLSAGPIRSICGRVMMKHGGSVSPMAGQPAFACFGRHP